MYKSSTRFVRAAFFALSLLVFLTIGLRHSSTTAPPALTDLEHLETVIHQGKTWHIPPSWLERAKAESNGELLSSTTPQNILEAAQLALELAVRQQRYLKHSNIPLIVHQTWKDAEPAGWSTLVRKRVNSWLDMAVTAKNGPETAYFLWLDDDLDRLFTQLEPSVLMSYNLFPFMVEKTDLFRVAVLKWFGGVYADVDTLPLKHPWRWVRDGDILPWQERTSTQTHQPYKSSAARYRAPKAATSTYRAILAARDDSNPPPVGAVVGIECDVAPSSDVYWRAGYTYPVQVTNWALAMAPQHPLATRYIRAVDEAAQRNATHLQHVDPLDLTGPPMLTRTAIGHCEDEVPGFDWNQLSGIEDDVSGRGKVAAGDLLVLPITAFSPGKGKFHNMGSQPISHPNARLSHKAEGTWRRKSVLVEVGKLCRTVMGQCRLWSKIP